MTSIGQSVEHVNFTVLNKHFRCFRFRCSKFEKLLFNRHLHFCSCMLISVRTFLLQIYVCCGHWNREKKLRIFGWNVYDTQRAHLKRCDFHKWLIFKEFTGSKNTNLHVNIRHRIITRLFLYRQFMNDPKNIIF